MKKLMNRLKNYTKTTYGKAMLSLTSALVFLSFTLILLVTLQLNNKPATNTPQVDKDLFKPTPEVVVKDEPKKEDKKEDKKEEKKEEDKPQEIKPEVVETSPEPEKPKETVPDQPEVEVIEDICPGGLFPHRECYLILDDNEQEIIGTNVFTNEVDATTFSQLTVYNDIPVFSSVILNAFSNDRLQVFVVTLLDEQGQMIR